ncbi:MAG: tRNA (cytidine(34)-2'-O)-methyltransferase [Burkholderiales bacterium]|jgi:tRNA (cytidine/uridine-2'-O-)-methyltransferase|nr:tRNA (cytidine(34)-2'-O)-methyltransferase [Burkholderiales bacterium]
MLEVVLYQPEIPANAGNVIRLAANAGVRLHLVRPLGFRLSDRALKRAGLDYAAIADVRVHPHWDGCRDALAGRRMYAFTTRGAVDHASAAFAPDDVLVFGPETRGLPDAVLAGFPTALRLRIPMRAGNRSLNLSNAVAIAVYEAWRQLGFAGARAGDSPAADAAPRA